MQGAIFTNHVHGCVRLFLRGLCVLLMMFHLTNEVNVCVRSIWGVTDGAMMSNKISVCRLIVLETTCRISTLVCFSPSGDFYSVQLHDLFL